MAKEMDGTETSAESTLALLRALLPKQQEIFFSLGPGSNIIAIYDCGWVRIEHRSDQPIREIVHEEDGERGKNQFTYQAAAVIIHHLWTEKRLPKTTSLPLSFRGTDATPMHVPAEWAESFRRTSAYVDFVTETVRPPTGFSTSLVLVEEVRLHVTAETDGMLIEVRDGQGAWDIIFTDEDSEVVQTLLPITVAAETIHTLMEIGSLPPLVDPYVSFSEHRSIDPEDPMADTLYFHLEVYLRALHQARHEGHIDDPIFDVSQHFFLFRNDDGELGGFIADVVAVTDPGQPAPNDFVEAFTEEHFKGSS